MTDRRKICLLVVFLYTFLTYAQEEHFKFGLYAIKKSKEIENIYPKCVYDRNVSYLYMPIVEKPNMTLYIEDAENYTVNNQQPEFLFFFINEEDKEPLCPQSIAKIVKNYPFVYGKTPNDFKLIRIFPMKKGNAIRLEKEKVFTGMKYNVFSEDIISFTSIPINGNTYKVILESKLPKGEYGFIYNKAIPHDIVIYTFEIE